MNADPALKYDRESPGRRGGGPFFSGKVEERKKRNLDSSLKSRVVSGRKDRCENA